MSSVLYTRIVLMVQHVGTLLHMYTAYTYALTIYTPEQKIMKPEPVCGHVVP